jgi:hypothetical protein
MRKAQLRPAPTPVAAAAASAAADSSSASAAEIAALNAKVAKMQGEIDLLKKQLTQVVTLIKQKLK